VNVGIICCVLLVARFGEWGDRFSVSALQEKLARHCGRRS
jgi:hypothetical protein